MVEQSFEDLGAVFEAEGKAVNRHKREKGGEAETRVGVGAGAGVCGLVNQGTEIDASFIGKPGNDLKLVRAPWITLGPRRIIVLF